MIYKVTIITVCYNAEKVIEKTINSVLSQLGWRIEAFWPIQLHCLESRQTLVFGTNGNIIRWIMDRL